jgi:hypothetical protein
MGMKNESCGLFIMLIKKCINRSTKPAIVLSFSTKISFSSVSFFIVIIFFLERLNGILNLI